MTKQWIVGVWVSFFIFCVFFLRVRMVPDRSNRLCGCFPFFEKKGLSMYEQIQKGIFSFPEHLWKDISFEGIHHAD